MDGNILIDTIKNGITLFSPALQGAVTALITTLFLRKNTNTTEFEKLKAGKISEAIDDLLESGKMSYSEFYKCHNFLKIAKLADEFAKNHKNIDESQFSFDWFMRFFDAVGNIGNEDLQKLWGHILANEISTPKTCSLRTLDMIRNMSSDEARIFNSLCRYVMICGITHFIYPNGFYDKAENYHTCSSFMEAIGFNHHNSISLMYEIGALTGNHDLAIYLDKNTKLQIHNDNVLCIIEYKNKKSKLFQQEAYCLTSSGIELYNIVRSTPEFKADMEYAILCFKEMKREKPEIKISAYTILGSNNGEFHYDSTNLL